MQIEDRGGMARESVRGTGWLSRLRRDARGNTLAIVGAALVPLAGMIGSGVDMSRAYMAKTRLQSACDAAALAGRRVMQNDTMNSTVQNEALRFFNFNFRQGLYSTSGFSPTVTRPSSGTVRVTASAQFRPRSCASSASRRCRSTSPATPRSISSTPTSCWCSTRPDRCWRTSTAITRPRRRARRSSRCARR